jgi:nucleotide-binding universal stress UspA family protein
MILSRLEPGGDDHCWRITRQTKSCADNPGAKARKKEKLFQKSKYFLIVDGYDPRIHALYFCPQLYRKEDGALVPLSGQEIGQLMAQAMEGGAVEKLPWYQPSDGVPEEPIIDAAAQVEFDSLVVGAPIARPNEPVVLRTGGFKEKKTDT